MALKLIARKGYRIGVQSLYKERDTEQHYIELLNRTYHTLIPLPPEKVEVWKELLS